MVRAFTDLMTRVTTPTAYSRRMVYLYAIGLVMALQATSLVEAVWGITISTPLRVAVVVVASPLLIAAVGVVLYPPPEDPLPARLWFPNALVMLLVWAGGYFLVGMISAGGPFFSMESKMDGLIPFQSSWVFVYVTVYPFFLFPLFYLDDVEDLFINDLAQVSALCIAYTTFVLFPVAFPREPLAQGGFAEWALSIVHAKDPPWNCFPSTHCTASTVVSLSLMRSNWKLSVWAMISTVMICISTLMTKQHFLWDVVAGVILGAASFATASLVVRRTSLGGRVRALAGRWGGK